MLCELRDLHALGRLVSFQRNPQMKLIKTKLNEQGISLGRTNKVSVTKTLRWEAIERKSPREAT